VLYITEQIIARNNTLCMFLFVLVVFFFEFETFSVYNTESDSSAGEFLLHIVTL
jgi:hypothetical protein